MVQSNDIKAAYEKLEAAKEELYQREEARIEATLHREAGIYTMPWTRPADGITDPARQQAESDEGHTGITGRAEPCRKGQSQSPA